MALLISLLQTMTFRLDAYSDHDRFANWMCTISFRDSFTECRVSVLIHHTSVLSWMTPNYCFALSIQGLNE
jgi:hypothetical protein